MRSGNRKTTSARMKAAFLAIIFACGIPVSAFNIGEKFAGQTETRAEGFSVITVDHSAILSNPHSPDKPRLTPSSPMIKPDASVVHIASEHPITDISPGESYPRSPLFVFARFSTSTFF